MHVTVSNGSVFTASSSMCYECRQRTLVNTLLINFFIFIMIGLHSISADKPRCFACAALSRPAREPHPEGNDEQLPSPGVFPLDSPSASPAYLRRAASEFLSPERIFARGVPRTAACSIPQLANSVRAECSVMRRLGLAKVR